MNFELVPNWQTVLFHSWAVRIKLIAGFFSALDAGAAYMAEGKLGTTALVSGLSLAAVVARVVKQTAISGAGGDDE